MIVQRVPDSTKHWQIANNKGVKIFERVFSNTPDALNFIKNLTPQQISNTKED